MQEFATFDRDLRHWLQDLSQGFATFDRDLLHYPQGFATLDRDLRHWLQGFAASGSHLAGTNEQRVAAVEPRSARYVRYIPRTEPGPIRSASLAHSCACGVAPLALALPTALTFLIALSTVLWQAIGARTLAMSSHETPAPMAWVMASSI